ncbi:MAG: hypothetical protein HRT35_26735 [Algicola sp.]|nr:hypothetical protein [Algicola sp.]
MTTNKFTRNSVVLDPSDFDGILDIARYGLEPLINQAPTITLLNNLIYRIASMALGEEIPLQPYNPTHSEEMPADFDDDELPIGDGTIILTVTPMDILSGRE